MFSGFVNDRVDSGSLRHLQGGEGFTVSISGSPILLVAIKQGECRASANSSSAFLFVDLRVCVFVLSVCFFFYSLTRSWSLWANEGERKECFFV